MIAANRKRRGTKRGTRRDWPGDELGHRYAAKKGWLRVAQTGKLGGKTYHRIYSRGRDASYDPAPRRKRKSSTRRPTRRRATHTRRRDAY